VTTSYRAFKYCYLLPYVYECVYCGNALRGVGISCDLYILSFKYTRRKKKYSAGFLSVGLPWNVDHLCPFRLKLRCLWLGIIMIIWLNTSLCQVEWRMRCPTWLRMIYERIDESGDTDGLYNYKCVIIEIKLNNVYVILRGIKGLKFKL